MLGIPRERRRGRSKRATRGCAGAAGRTRSRATARATRTRTRGVPSGRDWAALDAGAGDLGDAGMAWPLRPMHWRNCPNPTRTAAP